MFCRTKGTSNHASDPMSASQTAARLSRTMQGTRVYDTPSPWPPGQTTYILVLVDIASFLTAPPLPHIGHLPLHLEILPLFLPWCMPTATSLRPCLTSALPSWPSTSIASSIEEARRLGRRRRTLSSSWARCLLSCPR